MFRQDSLHKTEFHRTSFHTYKFLRTTSHIQLHIDPGHLQPPKIHDQKYGRSDIVNPKKSCITFIEQSVIDPLRTFVSWPKIKLYVKTNNLPLAFQVKYNQVFLQQLSQKPFHHPGVLNSFQNHPNEYDPIVREKCYPV